MRRLALFAVVAVAAAVRKPALGHSAKDMLTMCVPVRRAPRAAG